MWLKLVILGLIFFALYRLMGGKLPKMRKGGEDRVSKGENSKKIQEDTLIECEKCGTYVTYKESIIIHGKSYCSKECAGV
jgi:uncharacterized protein